MSHPSEYSVGWICAIDTEYVAAQAFLDEKHEGPEYVSQHDNNDYTLGKIGKHNVVIAVLPDGEYGLSSAASVARDMLHSFPNVRIGLMVGIGGGAPSPRHDIRLGDVVVSAPRDGRGGVFQYDFGKTVQGQSFHNTKFLDQPPTVLRTAISGLKSQYESDGHQLDEAIKLALDQKPRLRKKYSRPGSHTDRLYQAEALHNDETCCAIAPGNDISNVVQRPVRTEDEDNPAIHHGLVASANQLMKDALVRNRLSKEMDVLCFEMEAAGLMNHFPCLVIRGICDYSDTHKNKEWQGYAAMAAAAYAKDLLKRIAPNRLEAERKLSEVVNKGFSAINENLEVVYSLASETKTGVQGLQVDSHLGKIRSWLSPPDPSSNFNNAIKQRHPGSGQWLLRSLTYTAWKGERNSFLWLNGIPGCGKTILSSTIIDDLERSKPCSETLLYFYFDFRDTQKQTHENAVCSLIYQLYDKNDSVRRYLDSHHSRQLGGPRPDITSLCAIFQNIVEQIDEVWIVLDALDECSIRKEYPTGGLLPWVESLRRFPSIHLLVTSRPEQDIKDSIEKYAKHGEIVPLQSEFTGDDIRGYVQARVRESDELRRWRTRPEIQSEIEDTLIEKANGMFRWVSCQFDALEQCIGRQEVRNALANLPRTLDDTYARILSSIPLEHWHYAKRILQFLSFSERPLLLDEMVDAIAVEPTSTPAFDPENRIPVPEEISKYCSSLVVFVRRKDYYPKSYESHESLENDGSYEDDEDTEDKMVTEIQLAHFSVKEYLTSDRLEKRIAMDLDETAARTSMSEVCLTYLLDLGKSPYLREIRQSHPMAEYSAKNWSSHAAVVEAQSERVRSLIMKLFSCKESFETSWKLEDDDSGSVPRTIYYASHAGLVWSVRSLLQNGADVNIRTGRYGSALQAASARGHDKIVQILLENGANVNAQYGYYGNALQLASVGGHEKTVQILLEKGADVNVQNERYGNALQAASAGGYENIVQILLENGADVNAQYGSYGHALQAASVKGHEKVVQILLENGADVNAQYGRYGGALEVASAGGHEKIVQILLENGADINVQNGYYGNALQIASTRGHEKIVQLLLKNGADVDVQNGLQGNSLQIASAGGYEKIVQILLENGANVNVQNGYYGNALQAASAGGHAKIVQILLKNGADVNTQNGHYGNAFQAASVKGHEKIVLMLLENGCLAQKDEVS